MREYGYNANGQLSSMRVTANGLTIGGSELSFDGLQVSEATLLGLSGGDRAHQWGYDGQGRLVSSSYGRDHNAPAPAIEHLSPADDRVAQERPAPQPGEPGSAAFTSDPGHKLREFVRGSDVRAFAYGGAERIDDGRFAYEYDDRGRMIRATEKGAGRRIHYFYSGNNRVVGRRAEYGPPYRLEDRPEILAEDGVPPDVTYVWDPITDRIAAIYRTGSSQNPSIDPNGGVVRQLIHGGLGYDDPIEVVYADPSTGKVERMYPVFDEPAAGGLQLLASGDGKVVSRQVTQDPYGGEETTLAGAAVDKITVTARKSDAGTLESVQVDVRLTEEVDADSLAKGGARISGATVTPSIANPFTIRWRFTPVEWSALPSLTIQITDQLRAAAWSDSTPILPPPDWALASKPVSTSSSVPFEYRESHTSLATWLATVHAGESGSTTLYEVENLATLGSKKAANLTRLIVASTFQALPFTDPATGLVYARSRWLDRRTGTFLSPDPMGYRDSSNLYAFAGGDPVNGRDPTGEAAYLIYRQFNGGVQQGAYPAMGHFFLAFDEADLPDKQRWMALVQTHGGQKRITGKNRTPKRDPLPNAETFSFHPRNVNKHDDQTGVKFSTLVTEGSYIGYNDEVDQEAFRRGRWTLIRGEKFNPPIEREWVWKIPATQDQQESLYRRAIQERKAINSGANTFGDYLLNDNNCGTWAQYIITSSGLRFPLEAQFCGNFFGVGVNGPMQQTKIPAAITSYGQSTVQSKEDTKRWWEEIVSGLEGIATAVTCPRFSYHPIC